MIPPFLLITDQQLNQSVPAKSTFVFQKMLQIVVEFPVSYCLCLSSPVRAITDFGDDENFFEGKNEK